MQIVLPTEIKTFVERVVASGRYEDAEHVVIEALKRMADEPYPTMTVTEAVAESLTQIERGEGIAWTDDFLERSAERAIFTARRSTCWKLTGTNRPFTCAAPRTQCSSEPTMQ